MGQGSNGGMRPPIHLIDSEADAIAGLALQVEHRLPVVSAMLLTEIDRAEFHRAEELPEGVVSMGAEVDFLDEGSGQQRTVKLVLPGSRLSCRVVPDLRARAFAKSPSTLTEMSLIGTGAK